MLLSTNSFYVLCSFASKPFHSCPRFQPNFQRHLTYQPEEFMELDGSVTTHVDVIRPPSSAPLEGVVGVSPLVCPPSPVLPVTHVSGSGSTTNESHSSLVNKNTTASGGAQGTFVVCELCKATFSKRSNFYRHLRRAHEADSNLFRAKPQGVKGKCPECDSRFFSRHELLLHLAHNHDLEVVLFNITFTNKEAYARWLEDIKVSKVSVSTFMFEP